MELEALWKSVIELKYEGMLGGWCTREVYGAYAVGIWKHIRGWGIFVRHTWLVLGNGSRIKFWTYQW